MKRSRLLIGLFMVLSLTLPLRNVAAEEEPPRAAKEKKAAAPTDAKKISTDRLAVESPLVRAARLARESRKDGKKSSISITDEDVRASTGRITVGKYAGPDPESSPNESTGEILKKMENDRERSARESKEAAERVAELEREVARLERASALLENEYYEHSDATDREDEIMTAFESTRRSLDEKRDELAAARELLNQKRLEASNIVKP
jgi:chromosome segregation ATPase